MISPADGEVLVSLKEGHHPSINYMKALRRELPRKFPDLTFFFAPADIVTQVLNFGLSSPIDIQIAGPLPNDAPNVTSASGSSRTTDPGQAGRLQGTKKAAGLLLCFAGPGPRGGRPLAWSRAGPAAVREVLDQAGGDSALGHHGR